MPDRSSGPGHSDWRQQTPGTDSGGRPAASTKRSQSVSGGGSGKRAQQDGGDGQVVRRLESARSSRLPRPLSVHQRTDGTNKDEGGRTRRMMAGEVEHGESKEQRTIMRNGERGGV